MWFLALALAVVLDIAGAVYVLRDAYRYDIEFGRLGLATEIENDGAVAVQNPLGLSGVQPIPPGSHIVSARGQPVPRETAVWDLSRRLSARDGETVVLRLQVPGGGLIERRITASDRYMEEARAAAPIDRDVRLMARMTISLLTCLTLIGCAVLLFVRRPQDPVALLFSFSFLFFAGSIDPPLLLWMASGMGEVYDFYSALAWVLLVVGIAAFPDGVFTPRSVRWILVAAPIGAIPLMVDEVPLLAAAVVAFVLPLFLLVSHVIKYRRFDPGIERQQVKWAAFGFAAGLALLMAAFVLTATADDQGRYASIYGLVILVLFNLGFLAMAIGLLISIMRFRLWEADKVISRSAISAAVTLMVGVIWTLSMDGLKLAVEWALGEENTAIATAAGAVLAAGIFAPTQAVAMRWARRRLEGDESRIQRLIARLAVWRTTETPQEIGTRTLSALNAAIHCSCAALLVDTPRGLQVLASRDVEQPELLDSPSFDPGRDRRFARVLTLEDDDGPMGQLLIGPRTDNNRYNAAQIDGLTALVEPLAEALRASLKRTQHAETVQLKLGAVEERLARLEQGGPRLSPT